MIHKTKYASFCINALPEGCKLCVQGKKLVLFISGKCKRACFYCPLSEKRKGIDAVWANERKLSDVNALAEAIEEAKISKAKGAGITGGDPLLFVPRVCRYAKALKKKFGKKFHIHIYLPATLVTKQKLAQLAASGIDEVRFHPSFLKQDIENEIKKVSLARDFKWQVGIEIPAFPSKEKETIGFIEAALSLLDFININELEISDTNLEALMAFGYKAKQNGKKGETNYVVEGSQETALKILKWIGKQHSRIRVHYCSAATKNLFQYSNRLKLRTQSILKPYDILTSRFTLYRAALYLTGYEPLENYAKVLERLAAREKNKIVEQLKIKLILLKKLISVKFIALDKEKLRILCPAGFAMKFKEEIKQAYLVPALVEELPTYDATLIQLEFL